MFHLCLNRNPFARLFCLIGRDILYQPQATYCFVKISPTFAILSPTYWWPGYQALRKLHHEVPDKKVQIWEQHRLPRSGRWARSKWHGEVTDIWSDRFGCKNRIHLQGMITYSIDSKGKSSTQKVWHKSWIPRWLILCNDWQLGVLLGFWRKLGEYLG